MTHPTDDQTMLNMLRDAAKARLRSRANAAHGMNFDEIKLMTRLLDEYDRKARAWRVEASKQAKLDRQLGDAQ